MKDEKPVTSIVSTLDGLNEDGPVDAARILEEFGQAAVAAVMILPALLVASPLSAIPLFSSVCGLCIALVAVQGALGRDHLWLPGFLRRRTLPQEKTRKATGPMYRIAGWLDYLTDPRLSLVVRGPMKRMLYLVCAAAALCIPVLELVPMASTTIGFAVVFIGVGLLARDGLFALGGLAVMGAAVFLVTRILATAQGLLG